MTAAPPTAGAPSLLPDELTDAQRRAVPHTGGPLLVVEGRSVAEVEVRGAELLDFAGLQAALMHLSPAEKYGLDSDPDTRIARGNEKLELAGKSREVINRA